MRKNINQSNVVNQQYRTPKEKIRRALEDYASGQFKFKKDVAKKHNLSTPTLVRHANLRGVTFIKESE
ncbi:hypothetical protein AB4391_10555 [Vibrio lentus]